MAHGLVLHDAGHPGGRGSGWRRRARTRRGPAPRARALRRHRRHREPARRCLGRRHPRALLLGGAPIPGWLTGANHALRLRRFRNGQVYRKSRDAGYTRSYESMCKQLKKLKNYEKPKKTSYPATLLISEDLDEIRALSDRIADLYRRFAVRLPGNGALDWRFHGGRGQ